MKIYHNPRCSKSREALQLLRESEITPEIVHYLDQPPTFEELKSIIASLGISPFQLLRQGETIYKEKFAGQSHSDDEWIKIMVENPSLIERPIVVAGKRAVIGRPPALVKTLL
ncbi:MAG: arsenate reductase (glutaredoxin) [Cyclobacteriaceae bacterium]|nr:arsenate reductase (glutaredoxin) [Cyclobacteriaceae bacterium]